MKLRFEVDQAHCFRNGIECPKSIVEIEVDPATLPQIDRHLIADRLVGIDVSRLQWNPDQKTVSRVIEDENLIRMALPDQHRKSKKGHVQASTPSLGDLIFSCRFEQAILNNVIWRHRFVDPELDVRSDEERYQFQLLVDGLLDKYQEMFTMDIEHPEIIHRNEDFPSADTPHKSCEPRLQPWIEPVKPGSEAKP